MRAATCRFDRKLSSPNTFRVTEFGPSWVRLEIRVKITDQAPVVDATVLCTNVRGHGTRGKGVRYMFRLSGETFAVESGVFEDANGKPVDMPRMGLVLTDVPDTCHWVKKWDPAP